MDLERGIEETHETTNDEILVVNENESGYSADLMVHQDLLQKISKISLNPDKTKVFKIENSLLKTMQNAFKRKNEIYYCVSTKEILQSLDCNFL